MDFKNRCTSQKYILDCHILRKNTCKLLKIRAVLKLPLISWFIIFSFGTEDHPAIHLQQIKSQYKNTLNIHI